MCSTAASLSPPSFSYGSGRENIHPPSRFHAGKTVSRVLYLAVIYLGGPLPDRSSHLLRTAGPALCPPAVLLRIEFTASDSLQPMGELLPRLSTLTGTADTPRGIHCQIVGGPSMGAAARSNAAVYFCCTFPEVAFGGRYPLSLPCGARTFLTADLSASPRDCLFYLRFHFISPAWACQPRKLTVCPEQFLRATPAPQFLAGFCCGSGRKAAPGCGGSRRRSQSSPHTRRCHTRR